MSAAAVWQSGGPSPGARSRLPRGESVEKQLESERREGKSRGEKQEAGAESRALGAWPGVGAGSVLTRKATGHLKLPSRWNVKENAQAAAAVLLIREGGAGQGSPGPGPRVCVPECTSGGVASERSGAWAGGRRWLGLCPSGWR